MGLRQFFKVPGVVNQIILGNLFCDRYLQSAKLSSPWQFSVSLMLHKTTLLDISCTPELKNLLVVAPHMSSVAISVPHRRSLVTRTLIFTLFEHRYNTIPLP